MNRAHTQVRPNQVRPYGSDDDACVDADLVRADPVGADPRVCPDKYPDDTVRAHTQVRPYGCRHRAWAHTRARPNQVRPYG